MNMPYVLLIVWPFILIGTMPLCLEGNLRVNLTIHSQCHHCSSAVFNLVVVGCIGVLKLLSINWYVEYLMRDMTVSESIIAL